MIITIWILFYLFTIVMILDLITTVYGVSIGMQELNPNAKPFADKPLIFAFGKLGGIVGVYVVIYLVDFFQNSLGAFYFLFTILIVLILSIIFCLLYLFVVNNLFVIYQIKKKK
jgi:hypothetical protein